MVNVTTPLVKLPYWSSVTYTETILCDLEAQSFYCSLNGRIEKATREMDGERDEGESERAG